MWLNKEETPLFKCFVEGQYVR